MHSTTTVSDEVNRKLSARNTSVQLLTLYTVHKAQRYRQTDGQTDDIMMPMPMADYTACSTIG